MFKELNGDPIAKLHYVGFLCVDNNKDVSSAIFQIMCRVFCQQTSTTSSYNLVWINSHKKSNIIIISIWIKE